MIDRCLTARQYRKVNSCQLQRRDIGSEEGYRLTGMNSRPERLGLETYKRLVSGTQRLGLVSAKFETRPGILVYFVSETITKF